MRTTLLLVLALAGCERAGPVANEEGRKTEVGANAVTAPGETVGSATAEAAPPSQANAPKAGHPCSVQDGKPVTAEAMRAIGTEPFWNARTEGRCVTYSTPDDQAGTRVWTKAETVDGRSQWTGALGGKPFVLAIRPSKNCSDGMSDRVYAFGAELNVAGETRRGCAEKA